MLMAFLHINYKVGFCKGYVYTPQILFTVHNPLISFRDKLIPLTNEPNKHVNANTNTLTHNFFAKKYDSQIAI
jgi:hypothetical protein